MDEVTYTLLTAADAGGKAQIRRDSDGMTAWCRLSWLKPAADGKYVAISNTKALRLDDLNWEN